MRAGDRPLRAVDIEPVGETNKRMLRQNVVTCLREWLARAEAGEVSEVMIIGIETADDSVSWSLSGTLSRAKRVGMLEMLKFETIAHGQESED